MVFTWKSFPIEEKILKYVHEKLKHSWAKGEKKNPFTLFRFYGVEM